MKYLDRIVDVTNSGNTAGIKVDDYEFLVDFIHKNNIETVLEFGPGDSTYAFLEKEGIFVYVCEYDKDWVTKNVEIFRDFENVAVLKFDNCLGISIPEIDGLNFDLVFVDSPAAKDMIKEVNGCGRLNTCLYGATLSGTIILHDAHRTEEGATIRYLEKLGWISEKINTQKGMCVLRKL